MKASTFQAKSLNDIEVQPGSPPRVLRPRGAARAKGANVAMVPIKLRILIDCLVLPWISKIKCMRAM